MPDVTNNQPTDLQAFLDTDISNLTPNELEKYRTLLAGFERQLDSKVLDSIRARIDEREKVLQQSFTPQEALEAWQQAVAQNDETKMSEIARSVEYIVRHYQPDQLSNESMDNIYALYDLLVDQKLSAYLPEDDEFSRTVEDISGKVSEFEKKYGLNFNKPADEIMASHEKLDAISTEDLIQSLDDETKDLLNRLTVVRPSTEGIETSLKAHVNQDQPDNDIALILERTRLDAQLAVANRSDKDVTASFIEEFKDQLQYNIFVLAGADDIRNIIYNEKRHLTQEDWQNIYQNFLETKAPISIDQRTLAVWHAQHQKDTEVALKRMEKRNGLGAIVKTMRGRLAELDEKCHKKYGNWYNLAKTALKSAGWGAAYSVSAACGPIGITAVATASFANNAYKQYKEYKKAKENNPELKSFWGYLKNNKMAAASLALGAFSATTAAIGISGDTAVKAVKGITGASLGLAGAFKASAKAFKETKGSRFDKTKAALKSFGSSAAGFVVGMLAGRAAGSAIQGHTPTESNSLNTTPEPVQNAGTNPLAGSFDNVLKGEHPFVDRDYSDPKEFLNTPEYDWGTPAEPEPTPVQPEISTIDLNNLSAEQQYDLDMLIKRDPRELYELLGKHGITSEHFSSADAQALYNSAPDDVKTEIIQFAGERFDDKGYFQDMDGHTSAADMEAEAKAWTAAHTPVDRAPAETTVDPNTSFTPYIKEDSDEALAQDLENPFKERTSDETAPLAPLPDDENRITLSGEESHNYQMPRDLAYQFAEDGSLNLLSTTDTSLPIDTNNISQQEYWNAQEKIVYDALMARQAGGETFAPESPEGKFLNQYHENPNLVVNENGKITTIENYLHDCHITDVHRADSFSYGFDEQGQLHYAGKIDISSVISGKGFDSSSLPDTAAAKEFADLAKEHVIYNDLINSASSEHQLNETERAFMNQHALDLENKGIVDKNGVLFRATPQAESSLQETHEQTSPSNHQENAPESKEKTVETPQAEESASNASQVYTTESGVNYQFTENGLFLEGQIKGLNVQSLVNPETGASMIEENRIRNVAINDIVYMDMLHRQEQGETLPSQAESFIQHHEKSLQQYGFTHNDEHKLVRVDSLSLQSSEQQSSTAEPQHKHPFLDRMKARREGRSF